MTGRIIESRNTGTIEEVLKATIIVKWSRETLTKRGDNNRNVKHSRYSEQIGIALSLYGYNDQNKIASERMNE